MTGHRNSNKVWGDEYFCRYHGRHLFRRQTHFTSKTTPSLFQRTDDANTCFSPHCGQHLIQAVVFLADQSLQYEICLEEWASGQRVHMEMNTDRVLGPKYKANYKAVEQWKSLNLDVTSNKLRMLTRRIQCVMIFSGVLHIN
jgi:hypothetical protein